MTQLLIVDDEPHFRNSLLKALKHQGYHAASIDNADLLTSALAIQQPDVILLDLNFDSGTDGIVACEQLRRWSSVAVIVISVQNDEATKVRALSVGADDYLVKPFGILELVARIEAIQRRLVPRYGVQNPVVQAGDLTVNLQTQTVMRNRQVIDLTKKEYKLLEMLIRARGELVTYQMLMGEMWPYTKIDVDKGAAIRTLVKRLRQKLGEDLSDPTYILTQAGMGFRLNVRPASNA